MLVRASTVAFTNPTLSLYMQEKRKTDGGRKRGREGRRTAREGEKKGEEGRQERRSV